MQIAWAAREALRRAEHARLLRSAARLPGSRGRATLLASREPGHPDRAGVAGVAIGRDGAVRRAAGRQVDRPDGRVRRPRGRSVTFKRMADEAKRVCITGVGAVSPFRRTADELWAGLAAGRSAMAAIAEIGRAHV